ncbi:hypothetical protein M9Y10_016027 [Tritrichomonas musculus]|uniref:Uncharacterized protein n=1 Tax=Tritrichomonas musculus TaxID=1915356 RepID=A0ABR2I5C3_9EUKA
MFSNKDLLPEDFTKEDLEYIKSDLTRFWRANPLSNERQNIINNAYEKIKLHNPLIEHKKIEDKYIELLRLKMLNSQSPNQTLSNIDQNQPDTRQQNATQQSSDLSSPQTSKDLPQQQISSSYIIKTPPTSNSPKIVIPQINNVNVTPLNTNSTNLREKSDSSTFDNDISDVEEITKEQLSNNSSEQQNKPKHNPIDYFREYKLLKSEKDYFARILECFNSLHKSQSSIDFDKEKPDRGVITFKQEYIDFEIEIEYKMVALLKNYIQNFQKKIFPIYDTNCEMINIPKANPMCSPSRTNYVTCHQQPPQPNTIIIDTNDRNIHFLINRKFWITSYSRVSNLRRYHLDNKTLTMYFGEIVSKPLYAYRLQNVEAITVVSYRLKLTGEYPNRYPCNDTEPLFNVYVGGLSINEKVDEFLVCHNAYVYFSEEKKRVLNFFGSEIDTEFTSPAKSIHFNRQSEVNKLFVSDDNHIKEFLINGFDEYVRTVYKGEIHPVEWYKESDKTAELRKKMVNLTHGKNYYFDKIEANDKEKPTAMTVCNNELVFAYGSFLFFWKLNDNDSLKEVKYSDKIEDKEITRISQLRVIQRDGYDGYLAVSSEYFPSIHIYDKTHKNIVRLVGHTLGIKSLCGFSSVLFSSSCDCTVRVWDANKRLPMFMFLLSQNSLSSAIEVGSYCNQVFLFTASQDHTIQCWSIDSKRILFEINLNENVIPKKMVFISGMNKNIGENSKLMVISEFISQNNYNQEAGKMIHVQYFQFL